MGILWPPLMFFSSLQLRDSVSTQSNILAQLYQEKNQILSAPFECEINQNAWGYKIVTFFQSNQTMQCRKRNHNRGPYFTMTDLVQRFTLQAEGKAASHMSLGISGSFAMRFILVSFLKKFALQSRSVTVETQRILFTLKLSSEPVHYSFV